MSGAVRLHILGPADELPGVMEPWTRRPIEGPWRGGGGTDDEAGLAEIAAPGRTADRPPGP